MCGRGCSILFTISRYIQYVFDIQYHFSLFIINNIESLISHVICIAGNICLKRDIILFFKYIVDIKYSSLERSQLKRYFPVNDDFNDSVR